jgi:hypothetical protein
MSDHIQIGDRRRGAVHAPAADKASFLQFPCSRRATSRSMSTATGDGGLCVAGAGQSEAAASCSTPGRRGRGDGAPAVSVERTTDFQESGESAPRAQRRARYQTAVIQQIADEVASTLHLPPPTPTPNSNCRRARPQGQVPVVRSADGQPGGDAGPAGVPSRPPWRRWCRRQVQRQPALAGPGLGRREGGGNRGGNVSPRGHRRHPRPPGHRRLTPDGLLEQEVGSWTPTLTFDTPGDLNVTYGIRIGGYIKLGRLVVAQFQINTVTFPTRRIG